MIKEITLPCNSVMLVKSLRTKSQAEISDNPKWLPYADVYFETECVGIDNFGEEVTEEIKQINIPIQLRSIESLIEALQWLKQELEQ